MTWQFGNLTPMKYGVIMADPPWQFSTFSEAGEGRNASQHYETMCLDWIKSLRVDHLAADHCAMFLWGVSPRLRDVISVMDAWGFRFSRKAFCWAKTTKSAVSNPTLPIDDPSNWRMNLGYTTRANTEDCWLGLIGSPKRLRADIRELIVAPQREHSRKPDEAFDRAGALYGGWRLELFSRQEREGWDTWGNETGKFESGRPTA